nr:LysR family transcriptional regulator [Frigoribacterium sp. VKM Ac-2836]
MTDRTLDLDTLEVLERVAETGSISRAASALGVTQQAVSGRVRAAERAVGQPLVRRSTEGSAMTDTGRLLLDLGRPVLEASRRFEEGVAALGDAPDSIVVAASQTIAELFAPSWLREFRRRAPDSSVRLLADNSAAVIALVRSGDADVGFVETPSAPSGLSSTVITEDELVVVVAPDHPWATRPSISAEDLADAALLLREPGSGTRATVEAWLERSGLALGTPAAVLETTAIVRSTARAGMAPAAMSLRTVETDLAAGTLVRVELTGPPLVRFLHAVWSDQVRRGVSTFLRVARETR